MTDTITSPADLAGYPLGSTFTDRQGDVWMIDRFHPRGTGPQRIAVAGISSSWLVLHQGWQGYGCTCGLDDLGPVERKTVTRIAGAVLDAIRGEQ